MRILFIFLLGLITFQVSGQDKIIGSTTTAGGDLEGSYPNPRIKQDIINRANLTPGLRDSLLRFRKDTSITIGSGTANYASLANTFGRYNRVKITCLLPTSGTASVVLPGGADTLKNTEFKVTLYAQDSTEGVLNVFGFNGFAIYFDGTNINTQTPLIYIRNRTTTTCRLLNYDDSWYWLTESSKDWLNEELNLEVSSGITELTGDVTASGTGSVTTTISEDAVTSAKILNGTIVSADIASQTVDSVDIKNSSITTVKLETGAVTSAKVLDNSLTGSDLTYLTLRAGTTSNASLQLTSGADKSTLTGGEVMYNGSRFAVGIGSNKRRVAVTNDVAPSNGFVPIGNGTDYTNAALTGGTGITVTNGSGSITVGETVAKVASVSMVDADVNITTQVNSSLITHVNTYLTAYYNITVPTPSSTLIGRMITVNVNAASIGNGFGIDSPAGYPEFWYVDPLSTPTDLAPAAYTADGYNISKYTNITYTCRQINGTYYWVRDQYYDAFVGQNWYDYKTSVTGTTLTFDTYVPDGAYIQEKLRLYKNGLFMVLGVDYTVTDNYPFVVVNLVSASISGDKWYFTYQY